MPPLRQHNLRKLVRNLGAGSQPGEQQAQAQAQALGYMFERCGDDEDFHFRAAIVAFGAIPLLLVQLLGPGSSSEMQTAAAGTLMILAHNNDDNKDNTLHPVPSLCWCNC
jgi:hypothetical protein